MTPFVPANRLDDVERRERRAEYRVVVTRSLTGDSRPEMTGIEASLLERGRSLDNFERLTSA